MKERLTPEDKGRRALVKKAQRGDPRAFEELVVGDQEYLYRMAYLQVRSEADALDVVQETILKAYKSRKTLRDPDLFRSWLTKILLNAALDLLRRRKPQEPLEENLEAPAPQGLSPEERMDLYQALEDLSEPYRGLVKLKYLDGYTIREISESTGMPAGTVSVYLRRAMDKLRASLKEGAV